ncbi:phytanoyl-CoA dioxygenase family protein [Micromonospora rifamycinica]|uniref:Ectoine hydroxylase-related dioxygenase, phytanoyl-CoA dioxygenase (PhyH) family n=1 Tax=Micromonospora rifamycinica TaxID=291594 RepID=A0A109IP75_9ACTN|nr:phytanoyl-CoA dioxygenase family protein [Micromonospora rifamycinica]KWV34166.1 phytanoyl-CoA dioxygenase [Micromonospora rifamycinica]SCG58728.1 Ectoine hydroxylase-related dioxygenase, phytanoyl-CoA dioxygenase (PhyH) family [Micromonospora rifamycinica]
MDIGTALGDLGVTDDTLSEDERARLDTDGFLVLPGILAAQQLETIRRRLAELSAEEGDRAGTEVHREAGTDRLADLVNKDPAFDVCYTHPRVLAGIAHVLPDFTLSSLNSRAALPGGGHQGLHADWGRPFRPGDYQVCNSVWMIDDFTGENGATRVVPGSHRLGLRPAHVMDNTEDPHPDEITLLGAAGTVVVVNSHLWHGGTTNRTDRPRRALHSFFCRRGLKQQVDQAGYLRPATRDRLTPAARHILSVP